MSLHVRLALYLAAMVGASLAATAMLGAGTFTDHLPAVLASLALACAATVLFVAPLVRRLGELEQAATDETEQAQQLVNKQTQLLQAVSHEFRTPIARIRFALEMLVADETQTRRIETIDNNLTELDTLVEEILTYGKLDGGTAVLRTESIDVGSSLRDIVASTEALRDGVQVSVHTLKEGEPAIVANLRHFTRVIENLVLNAIRHSRSQVRVEYQAVGEHVIILVHDDGPGVPEAERDRVWEPFARVDASRSRDLGGFGLGLAIVRRIMEWHGGGAHVEDSQLGGAMFVTSWPIRSTHDA